MPIRPWYEIEQILHGRGASGDDIFSTKNRYFDFLTANNGLDPEEEEVKKRRKLFLYGNEKEWELFKAAKSGLIRGFGEIPETAADVIQFGQNLVPGESQTAEDAETRLRDLAEGIREKAGPFQPSSMPERIAAGVSQAPGVAASMVPFGAAAAAAVAATPLEGAALAGAATGALGFGAYEAIRNARGTPAEMVKGGLHGAALGGVLGASGRLTKGVGAGLGGGLKSKVAGHLAGGAAAGAGTGGLELITGAPPEQAAETAATFALLSAAHRNRYNKVSSALDKAGVADPKLKDAAFETDLMAEQQNLEFGQEERAGRKSAAPTIKASDISAETNVPFQAITGIVDWGGRFKKIRNTIPSKADLTEVLRKKLDILNMQKKAAREEPGARVIDEAGNERPSEGFSRYWDNQFQSVSRPAAENIRKAPDNRIGSVYAITDGSGQKPIFTIERVDWNKKSPAQWRVDSAVDATAEPKFYRTLAEAEQSLKGALERRPRDAC